MCQSSCWLGVGVALCFRHGKLGGAKWPIAVLFWGWGAGFSEHLSIYLIG